MTDVDDWRDRHDDDWEPDPTDWLEAEAQREHEDEAHDGKPCNCPVPAPEQFEAEWAERARQHREDEHDGGECNCPPPF